ncbi:MAG: ATPase domain-containing protein [archaeon]
MIERVELGIKRLDKALSGGLPKDTTILLSGSPGTGKSILCLQYLLFGAKKREKGIFFSTEQNKEELMKQASMFDWNLEKTEKQGLLKIVFVNAKECSNLLKIIEKEINNFKPQRIVIDSMTTLSEYISTSTELAYYNLLRKVESSLPIEEVSLKRLLHNLLFKLKEFNTTNLVTSETHEGSENLSSDGISEFICDGIIKMNYLGVGGYLNRSLMIRKMRYTEHKKDIITFKISKKGITVISDELL